MALETAPTKGYLTPSDQAQVGAQTEVGEGFSAGAEAPSASTTLGSRLIRRPQKLRGMRVKLRAPSTGNTTVQVRVDGVSKGSVTIASTDAAGTVKQVGINPPFAVPADSIVDLYCSALGSGSVGLAAYADLVQDWS